MSKRTAFTEALFLGGISLLVGGSISALPMLFFGFNIVSVIGVLICFIISALGGLYAYSVNMDKTKEDTKQE